MTLCTHLSRGKCGWEGVLICGFYGNYNLGDEAMLAGMIAYCKSSKMTYHLQSSLGPRTRHSVQSVRLNRRLKLNASWKFIRIFYFRGGDLLRDSVKSSIALNWLQPQQALQLRRRTLVLGINVGNLETRNPGAYSQVLNRVDLLIATYNPRLSLKLGVHNLFMWSAI